MLSAEKNYFLQIISDYICCDNSVYNENIDYETIVRFSKNHSLNGLIFNQISDYLTDEIKNDMFLLSAREFTSYTKRQKYFNDICNSFTKAKIKFFSVKGFDVAKYYKNPQHRTMGDCDIHVSSRNLKKADEILKSIGFSRNNNPMFENVYQKQGLTFEIHNHLLYDEIANKKNEIAFCNTVWDYITFSENSYEGKIDESFHFIYLLLHLKKHLIHCGAGFRQFIDLYLLAKNCDLDWNFIEKHLSELNLTNFAHVCGGLTQKWFGKNLNSPFGFELAPIDDEFFETATDKIFMNGVFGFNDNSNKSNPALQSEILKEKYNLYQKLVSKIRFVFPKYNDMRLIKKYSFIDNKPILLPVAWIYRFFCVLFKTSNKESNLNSNTNKSSSKVISERKDLLEKFGLL